MLDLRPLDDGAVRVCLTEDGITVCTTVSSHHLVPDKQRQLQNAILRTAVAVYSDEVTLRPE